MGYELLDDGLTDSTLWMFGSKEAKVLFVTIFSKCHGSEIVRTPIPVLVKLAGLTRDEGATAMAELEAPDPDSKCPSEDGRRVVRIEDEIGKGLFLPSYKSRRNRFLASDRKRSQRAREDDAVTDGHGLSRSVTARHAKFALKTETETETEQSKEKKERASRHVLIPPTVEEVRAYVAEKSWTLDPEAFVAFYESKGWKVGGQAMKSWKAACVTWQKREPSAGGNGAYPSRAEVAAYNKSMTGVSAEHYAEAFKHRFGVEPKKDPLL